MAKHIVQISVTLGGLKKDRVIGDVLLGGAVIASFDFFTHPETSIQALVAKNAAGDIIEAYIRTPMVLRFEEIP